MRRRRFAMFVGLALLAVVLGGVVWKRFAPDPGDDAAKAERSGRGVADASTHPAARSGENDAAAVDARRDSVSDAKREAERPTADADASRIRSTYVGRIVDERRFPIAGAQVTLRLFREGKLELPVGTSGADGRFELALTSPPLRSWYGATLWACDATGRFGFARTWFGGASTTPSKDGAPPRIDVGTLMLRSGATLRIAIEVDGHAAGGASLHLEVGKERTRVLESIAEANGTAVVRGVPLDEVMVVASTSGARGRTLVVPTGAQETDVRVVLQPTRAIDVRVLEKGSDAPIVGAIVTIEERSNFLQDRFSSFPQIAQGSRPIERAEARTDENGLARIDDLEAGIRGTIRATTDVTGDPYGSGDRMAHEALPDSDTEVILRLGSQRTRTVRWPVVAGSTPVPSNGSEIRMRRSQTRFGSDSAPLVGVIKGSELVLQNAPAEWLSLVAEAPDGSVAEASLAADADIGRAIEFKPGRRVEILVKQPSGAPASGVSVQLRDQGNNPTAPNATTGADGIARLEHLCRGLYDVYVDAHASTFPTESAGAANLAEQDARLEYTLLGDLEVIVQVLIDGAPGLPGDYMLSGGMGAPVLSSTDDVERGRIRVRMRATAGDAPRDLWMRAIGFLPAKVTLPKATGPTTTGTEPPLVTLALERAGSLLARVTTSANSRPAVLAQRWIESTSTWEKPSAQYSALRSPNGPGDSYLFEPIEPGRYRVLDETSGIDSALVDVVVGARAEVSLDLTTVVQIKGRVELPDGENPTLARVIIEDGRHATEPEFRGDFDRKILPGVGVDKSGAFQLFASTRPAARLRAWHPWLRPAAEGGRVDVMDAAQPVTLRLEVGPVVTFTPRFDGAVAERAYAIYLLTTEDGKPVTHRLAASPIGEAMRLAAPDATTATLVIDSGNGLAPVSLPDLELTGKDQDLGELLFRRGSAVKAALRAREGTSPPRIYISATSLDDPRYTRWMNSNGESEPLLAGLGKGRFEVQIGSVMDSTTLYRGTLELDGTSDVTLTIDVR